jgi:carboxyl-terminal processing protease
MSSSRPEPRARGLLLLALLLALALAVRMATTTVETPPVAERSLPRSHVRDVPALGGSLDSEVAMAEADAPDSEKDSKGAPKTDKPGEKRPEVPIYTAYLKDPQTLGFKPDAELFETVYHQIKTQHYDMDPDEKLYKGVTTEVGDLLKEARVNPSGLASLPLDHTLPQEIVRAYGAKVDTNLLWYAMIRGLLAGTGDPYSVIMTPKEYEMLMEQMQSESFGGIGIFIELDHDKKDQLTVTEPVEGTPAFRAGLLSGDQIVKIDGKPTDGMGLDQATTLIRGKIGTRVLLTVRRPGESRTRDFSIERGSITVPSVSHKMLPDNVGYIKLRLFGANTGKELDTALDELEKGGARALILDLRNNGGGYINSAVDVASHFIPPGGLVTYVTKKHGERSDYNGDPRPRTVLPTVLLVNQYSASASEITAGCFKDYGVATLIGVKTFGKGSVQQLNQLQDGAALKLTIAHFFTPKGNKINKVGVEPDIKVEMEARLVGRGDKDVQLKKALDYLKSKGII